MKILTTHFMLFLGFFIISQPTIAQNFKENLLFYSQLNGSNLVPSQSNDAKGLATFMVNKNRDSISINMSFVGIYAHHVALHLGQADQNGDQLLDLSSSIQNGRLVTAIAGAEVKNIIEQTLRSNLYIEVSEDQAVLQIRGQLQLASDMNFSGELSGQEVVPAATTFAYGLASIALSANNEKLYFKIICQELSSALTQAKLYIGTSGSNGVLAEDLSLFIDGNVIQGDIVPSASTVEALLSGQVYLVLHSTSNPNGELRAQLRHLPGIALEVQASGDQIVPPLSVIGEALGLFQLSPTFDTLTYNVVVNEPSSAIEYLHFHLGNAGEPYGALRLDFTSSISGNHIQGMLIGTALSSIDIKRLLASNLTLVVHTANHPTGEMRGQSIRFAHEGATILLNGDQVSPSVSTEAFGTGFVSINRNRDLAHFEWLVGGLSDIATSSGFYTGDLGENGTLVYNSTNTMETIDYQASAKGFWTNNDATPLTSTIVDQIKDNYIYLNIGTNANPAGEVRGQVISGTIFYPSTTSSNEQFNDTTFQVAIAPNPAQDLAILSIRSDFDMALDVSLYNMLGQKIMSLGSSHASMGTNSFTIPVSELSPGVYQLVITDGLRVYTSQIMKL